MTPHQQIVHGFQVIAHLIWFIFPLFAFTIAKAEKDNDGYWFILFGIIAQTCLAVGYIYGWNVK